MNSMSVALQRTLILGACAAAVGAIVYLAAPAPASAAFCPSLTRNLSQGASGQDVAQLQQFLAQDPSIYPERQISGSFGAQLAAAVQRYQCRFGIVCSGTAASTGFGSVGPATRAHIAQTCATFGGGTVPPQ